MLIKSKDLKEFVFSIKLFNFKMYVKENNNLVLLVLI